MDYSYIAFLLVLLLVVFLLAWWVVRANRRFGRIGAWGVIGLEAVAVGGLIYLLGKYQPDLVSNWIGQQLILAVVGVALAVVLGGGLVIGLAKR